MAPVSVFLSFVPFQMLKRMGKGSREINSAALECEVPVSVMLPEPADYSLS